MRASQGRGESHWQGPHDGRDFSVLIRTLGEGDGDRLPVAEMVHTFAGRGFGAIMLVIALINLLPLPPGGTTITGLPLLLLSLELALGGGLWLPRRVMDASVSRAAFRKGAEKVMPAVRVAERLSDQRLGWLVSGVGERLIGIASVILSLVLILPIPLGNFVPALAMALFALAIMERDGLIALLGWLTTAVAAGLLALVGNAAWDGAHAVVEGVLHAGTGA
jgi:hypothetical protein